MDSFPSQLSADLEDWLLDIENPTIRYRTLTELLGVAKDDGEALRALRQIDELPLVKEAFAQQHSEGHWGKSAEDPYRADGTLGTLAALHALRVTPNAKTALGCDSYLRYSQHASGCLSINRNRKSGIMPCSSGEHLPMLIYFGLTQDERIHRAFQCMIESMEAAEPLVCSRYENRPCLWGAIAALKGLAVLPPDLKSEQSRRVTERLCESLLAQNYDFEGEYKRWLSYSVPRAWDLLSALTVLAAHGCSSDPRFRRMLDTLLSTRDEDGRWRCRAVSRTWPLERRNAPSKWVTLDALLLLS